ncbi:APC family permease [Francisella sp. SYW-9]|uniref:APC family permease n=1 Tax=Francisella sp. SYW-9 TaxID=2610888 RepID=UPI00168D102E|nr:APC family permease [Francisella sp. SYW-9]
MSELKRRMGIWQLTAFGINYMVPTSSAIVFGIILKKSGGSVSLSYLLAGFIMLFVANSYILMSKKFPICGSLYSFISRGLNPHVGFITGWTLFLDYIFIPTIASMSSVLYFMQLSHFGNYAFLYCSFIVIACLISIRGINLLAKLGLFLLLLVMIIVISAVAVWAYSVFNGTGTGTLVSSIPFHFSSISSLTAAASIAVFCYLGFDAITTMSEETINPTKNVPRAIIISIISISIIMFLVGYIGVLVIPNWKDFINNPDWVNTALLYVSKVTGGHLLVTVFTAGFLLSQMVFILVANTAASRLLYAMGRDNVLPKSIFGKIHHKYGTPHLNLIIIMIVQIILGLSLNLNSLAEIVNFGAILGFTILTITVIHFYFKQKPSDAGKIRYVVIPFIGIILMIWLMTGLSTKTYIIGGSWMIIGIIFGFIRSKGYKEEINLINI